VTSRGQRLPERTWNALQRRLRSPEVDRGPPVSEACCLIPARALSRRSAQPVVATRTQAPGPTRTRSCSRQVVNRGVTIGVPCRPEAAIVLPRHWKTWFRDAVDRNGWNLVAASHRDHGGGVLVAGSDSPGIPSIDLDRDLPSRGHDARDPRTRLILDYPHVEIARVARLLRPSPRLSCFPPRLLTMPTDCRHSVDPRRPERASSMRGDVLPCGSTTWVCAYSAAVVASWLRLRGIGGIPSNSAQKNIPQTFPQTFPGCPSSRA